MIVLRPQEFYRITIYPCSDGTDEHQTQGISPSLPYRTDL